MLGLPLPAVLPILRVAAQSIKLSFGANALALCHCARLGTPILLRKSSLCQTDAHLGSLGEGDDIPDGGLIGQQHAEPVQSESDAAVRGRSHVKGIQQIPELRLRFLMREADGVKDLLQLLAPVCAQASSCINPSHQPTAAPSQRSHVVQVRGDAMVRQSA